MRSISLLYELCLGVLGTSYHQRFSGLSMLWLYTEYSWPILFLAGVGVHSGLAHIATTRSLGSIQRQWHGVCLSRKNFCVSGHCHSISALTIRHHPWDGCRSTWPIWWPIYYVYDSHIHNDDIQGCCRPTSCGHTCTTPRLMWIPSLAIVPLF